jgi:hypothetical protein
MLHFWIPVNMSWQVQQHFGSIMRYHHDSLEKQYSGKKKRCGLERFQDSFNVYGSILEYINGIVKYTKGM